MNLKLWITFESFWVDINKSLSPSLYTNHWLKSFDNTDFKTTNQNSIIFSKDLKPTNKITEIKKNSNVPFLIHLFRFSCKNESQTFLFRPTAAVIHVQNITFNKIPEENIKGNF